MPNKKVDDGRRTLLVGGATLAAASAGFSRESMSASAEEFKKYSEELANIFGSLKSHLPDVAQSSEYQELISEIIGKMEVFGGESEKNLLEYKELLGNKIDTKAKRILVNEGRGVDLEYDPLRVDENLHLLSQSLADMVSWKDEALEIESEIIDRAISVYRDEMEVFVTESLLELAKLFDGKVSSEILNPRISGDAIQGESSEHQYFSLKRDILSEQVTFLKNISRVHRGVIAGDSVSENLFDRYSEVRRRFDENLVDSFRLCRSIMFGVRRIYLEHKSGATIDAWNSILEIPELVDDGYLSKLLRWEREVTQLVRRLKLRTARSVVTIYIGDLSGPIELDKGWPHILAPGGGKNFGAQLAENGLISFSIDTKSKPELVAGLSNPRVMAVQVRLHDQKSKHEDRNGIVSHSQVSITLPTETFKELNETDKENTVFTKRPRVSIGRVPDTDLYTDTFHGGDQISYHRIDGKWEFKLDRARIAKGLGAENYSSLELSMLVAYEMEVDSP